VTVKASGDYTGELVRALRPGVPAKVAGPFGGFDYRRGGPEQIWIAGGIGVTPFMSWLRSLDDSFDRDVELFYSVRKPGEAVYRDEIEAAVKRHPSIRTLRVHGHRPQVDRPGRAALRPGRLGPVGLHVRSPADDEGARARPSAARRPARPRALGGIRWPVIGGAPRVGR
jgi:ferredoxin-NADP reductase